MRSRVSLLLLLSISVTILAYGQTERKPENYLPRTLRELSNLYPPYMAKAINERTEAERREMAIVVHTDLLPSRVKVVYEGTLRPLDERKKAVMVSWANRPEAMADVDIVPYQTEMRFTENGEDYWLVVRQDSLLKFQELQRGDTVQLFLVKMGNIRLERTDEKMEPVILVEKFAKQ
jgi:hypothetical protein